MQYGFLPEVWERCLVCPKAIRNHRIPVRLQLQCRTLTSDRCTYGMSHTTPIPDASQLMVDLARDRMEAVLGTFIRCLAVLPNLRALEVISMDVQCSRPLHKTLNDIKLPQIRMLFLPSVAHYLPRPCPNPITSHVSLLTPPRIC